MEYTLNNIQEKIEKIRAELRDKTLTELLKLKCDIDKQITQLNRSGKEKKVVEMPNCRYAVLVDAISLEEQESRYKHFKGNMIKTTECLLCDGDFLMICKSERRFFYYSLAVVKNGEIEELFEKDENHFISFLYDCYNVFYGKNDSDILDDLKD